VCRMRQEVLLERSLLRQNCWNRCCVCDGCCCCCCKKACDTWSGWVSLLWMQAKKTKRRNMKRGARHGSGLVWKNLGEDAEDIWPALAADIPAKDCPGVGLTNPSAERLKTPREDCTAIVA
jgi:hypothetical protein